MENCFSSLFGRKLFSDSNTGLILIGGLERSKEKVEREGSFYKMD